MLLQSLWDFVLSFFKQKHKALIKSMVLVLCIVNLDMINKHKVLYVI
jgi:hypothetical protein